jgi:3-deoxy-D-arabino-heptulosonate 7-phosphate (DAHP) synthase class II
MYQTTYLCLSTLTAALLMNVPAYTQASSTLKTQIDKASTAIETKVVAWRRDFHQNPELGNRETRTAGKIAAHLHALGIPALL